MSYYGGYDETMDADEEIQCICDQVKSQVEEMTNETYQKFIAVKYRKQVVAGTIFFFKVHVGGYLLLKVFQKLRCYGGEIKLLGVHVYGKDDPIEPF